VGNEKPAILLQYHFNIIMTQEKIGKPGSGYSILFLAFASVLAAVFCFIVRQPIPGAALSLAFILLLPGFFVNDPNESKVLILFGEYKYTVKDSGFFWANPFLTKKMVSLRAMNLNGTPLKVNDKGGNPIEIAAVTVWQVSDTAKAVFEVDNYQNFVKVQSEAAVRHLAGSFPYDNLEDESAEITLRGGAEKVVQLLLQELNEKLERAGIQVTDARISHLAYAPEIAGAMLQRQQATAVVAARKQIVDGAVGMVEMALEKLSSHNIVHLDEERKAAMVSNLLVVLCSDRSVSPVVNTGTLYH
jgi:regulator of protease activity HflC (stomatin/prohibitin superfamily)